MNFSGFKDAKLDSKNIHNRLLRATVPIVRGLGELLHLDAKGSKVSLIEKDSLFEKIDITSKIMDFLAEPYHIKRTSLKVIQKHLF